MNKLFGQKGLLITSQVENSRNVSPGSIIRQERKSFNRKDIYLDIHKVGKEHKRHGKMMVFFGNKIKIESKLKTWRLNE